MEEHVAHEDELEEEQMTQAVVTPTFTVRKIGKERIVMFIETMK